MALRRTYCYKYLDDTGFEVRGKKSAFSKLDVRTSVWYEGGTLRQKDIVVWNPEKESEPTFPESVPARGSQEAL